MHIEDAIKIVNSWPEWKKHLVENSMNPICPTRTYGKRIDNTMDNKTKEEIKDYISKNLKIQVYEDYAHNFNEKYLTIRINLLVEDQIISSDWIDIHNE